jgi:hypothetical protein
MTAQAISMISISMDYAYEERKNAFALAKNIFCDWPQDLKILPKRFQKIAHTVERINTLWDIYSWKASFDSYIAALRDKDLRGYTEGELNAFFDAACDLAADSFYVMSVAASCGMQHLPLLADILEGLSILISIMNRLIILIRSHEEGQESRLKRYQHLVGLGRSALDIAALTLKINFRPVTTAFSLAYQVYNVKRYVLERELRLTRFQ